MTDTKAALVTHYYDKIGVAVFQVLAPIKIGDKIKVKSEDAEFEQTVTSMQVEHQNIEKAKKGDNIGIKVDQPVKEGDEVFRVD